MHCMYIIYNINRMNTIHLHTHSKMSAPYITVCVHITSKKTGHRGRHSHSGPLCCLLAAEERHHKEPLQDWLHVIQQWSCSLSRAKGQRPVKTKRANTEASPGPPIVGSLSVRMQSNPTLKRFQVSPQLSAALNDRSGVQTPPGPGGLREASVSCLLKSRCSRGKLGTPN